jgi:hypothetical protein
MSAATTDVDCHDDEDAAPHVRTRIIAKIASSRGCLIVQER